MTVSVESRETAAERFAFLTGSGLKPGRYS